ncbi:ParA family protein [Gallaecimonas pentaromativorans]|uniref:Chromosome partitioning protein n=1 Tax=Gallaecimonas pentaromativorans TaxID=584787 RepID=A0A3N1NRY6_9GAMM|nr:ParA family protein [Gallaecimonas pentaromativorans]MED5526665.1 ParA family protein [Pseudomonadota bacterium]ROQ22564.1 chromosome partitioning protein [Gallaecimonas pentaromativorans]
MNIWTVANQKGGVGKTTTTVTLGALLAARGEQVLLIDMDPHASLTSYFNRTQENLDATLFDLMSSQQLTPALIDKATLEVGHNLFLWPAAMELATLDRQLGSREGLGLLLKQLLEKLDGLYAHVLIDCPPVLGVLMVNALAACQRVLVPVQTEFLAIKGLERMLRTLSMMEKSLKGKRQVTIVPTMFDKRTRASLEALKELHQEYGGNVWQGMVPVDTKFRDASREHVPLPVLSPLARGVQAYEKLLESLLPLEVSA